MTKILAQDAYFVAHNVVPHVLKGKNYIQLNSTFSRFIKFLNRNAYIEISISGESFCSAAKEAMRVIWANLSTVSIVHGNK